MHGGNEQAFAGDGDVGRGGRARLPLTRKWNDPRLLKGLRGEHGIPADRAVLSTNREEKRKEVPLGGHGAEWLVVTLDVLLQQHDVFARRGTGQPARREIVHKAHEIALPRVHVPGSDCQCDRRRCGWRNDLRPDAGRRDEKETNDAFYIAVAAFVRAADASAAADRSIVTEV